MSILTESSLEKPRENRFRCEFHDQNANYVTSLRLCIWCTFIDLSMTAKAFNKSNSPQYGHQAQKYLSFIDT